MFLGWTLGSSVWGLNLIMQVIKAGGKEKKKWGILAVLPSPCGMSMEFICVRACVSACAYCACQCVGENGETFIKFNQRKLQDYLESCN